MLANACGPCIGQWKRTTWSRATPNTILTSFNRNFPGRNDGRRRRRPSSPARKSSPRSRSPGDCRSTRSATRSRPRTAARCAWRRRGATSCPRAGSWPATAATSRPRPTDGREIELAPGSDLQLLEPFPRWDGKDFTDLPVVLTWFGSVLLDVETFLAEQYFDGSDLDPARSTLADVGFDVTEQACITAAVADATWVDDVINVTDLDDMELKAVLDIGADLDSCHLTAVLIASGYDDGPNWLPCLRKEVPATVSFVDVVEVRELGSKASGYAKVAPVLSSAAQKCIPTPIGTLMAQQIVSQSAPGGGTSPLPGAEACVSEGLATFGWTDYFAVGNRTAGELAPDSMVAVLDRCAPVERCWPTRSSIPTHPTRSLPRWATATPFPPEPRTACERHSTAPAGGPCSSSGEQQAAGCPPAMSKALDTCLPVGAVMAHVLADPESPNSISTAFGDGVQIPDDAEACLTEVLATATWAEISAGESIDGRSVVTDALDACVPYGPVVSQALAQQAGAPSSPEAQAAYIQCLSKQLASVSWADTANLRPDRGPIPDAQKACNAA